jgi:hypothetical protein
MQEFKKGDQVKHRTYGDDVFTVEGPYEGPASSDDRPSLNLRRNKDNAFYEGMYIDFLSPAIKVGDTKFQVGDVVKPNYRDNIIKCKIIAMKYSAYNADYSCDYEVIESEDTRWPIGYKSWDWSQSLTLIERPTKESELQVGDRVTWYIEGTITENFGNDLVKVRADDSASPRMFLKSNLILVKKAKPINPKPGEIYENENGQLVILENNKFKFLWGAGDVHTLTENLLGSSGYKKVNV